MAFSDDFAESNEEPGVAIILVADLQNNVSNHPHKVRKILAQTNRIGFVSLVNLSEVLVEDDLDIVRVRVSSNYDLWH